MNATVNETTSLKPYEKQEQDGTKAFNPYVKH